MITALKAVYTKGKVVTGVTHGDAFSKLASEDKSGNDFLIGNWCPMTGKFTGDGGFFFTKKILLIRHGSPENETLTESDPGLSTLGEQAVEQLSQQLIDEWEGCQSFSSPFRRCCETMDILDKALHFQQMSVDSNLVDLYEGETSEKITDRITEVLEILPIKTIIISHCALIQNIVKYIGADCPPSIPHASSTLIDHNQVIYAGRKG